MAESFDSYNAPRFFDFSKDLHREEDTDAYFEINHEDVEDPLRFRNSEEKQNESVKPKIEHYENIDSNSFLECRSSEELLEYVDSPVYSGCNEYVTSEGLRRSMSVGNVHLLCNQEQESEHKDADVISNAFTDLHLSDSPKFTSKSLSTNNLKGASSNRSLQKNCSWLSGSHSVRGSSMEYLNRLAQPKQHYGSAQNLEQNHYVSMAEAVRKFHSGTPTRFRSKPKLDNTKGACSKSTKTIPHSPALLTKQRHRPVNALTREEQEQKEYEEAQKFKIKAHPLNKRILQGPLKPLVPVEKKPLTIPEPFKITSVTRKVPQSPKKEIHEFHAAPVPKFLNEPPKLKKVEKPSLTKPQTPTFMKHYLKEPIKPQENHEEKKPSFKPGKTVPLPFSFEKRDQYTQRKKEEKVKKILEEEKRQREFHARPIPKSILNSMKSSSLQRSNSTDSVRPRGFSKSEESLSTQFKARPATVLFKKPFEPKKDERHLIEITEFQLNTEMRAKEREEFEQLKKEKEESIALAKQLEEEMRLQMEEEEVARLRKEAEYKAQPIKKYKVVKIQPSGKVTDPISPKFHTNKYRNRGNKENSSEDMQRS